MDLGDRGLIGIVIVAHGGLAREYLSAVEHVVGRQAGMAAISIEDEHDRGTKAAEIRDAADAVDQGEGVVEDAVGRLYRALHKVKRSYIRAFVSLLQRLELPFPRAIPRDLGVDVARKLAVAGEAEVAGLQARLARTGREEEQAEALRLFLKPVTEAGDKGPDQKLEFRVGDAKVTARNGELRIRAAMDFTEVDRADLDRAVTAFFAALGA